jgi:hypothetical protein
MNPSQPKNNQQPPEKTNGIFSFFFLRNGNNYLLELAFGELLVLEKLFT